MRAIILSDSHGDVRACMRAIEAMSPCDMIIHLGDIQRDVDFIKKEYPDIPVFSVMGNNELFCCGKTEDVVQFGDYRLFICHGHTFGVHRSTQRLEEAALKNGCCAALFGHTHIPVFEKTEDGLLLVNPGSVSRPRWGCESFAVLETEGGSFPNGLIVDWVI